MICKFFPEGATVALVGEGAPLALRVERGEHLQCEGRRIREGAAVLLVGRSGGGERGREDGLRLGVLLEPLAALGQQEARLGRLGAVLRQQVVGLGHAVGPGSVSDGSEFTFYGTGACPGQNRPEVAGGEEVQRLVGRQLRVEPLRQEGGVTVRVVVQAVPDGGLWGEDVSLHGKLHGTEPYLGLLSKGHTFV